MNRVRMTSILCFILFVHFINVDDTWDNVILFVIFAAISGWIAIAATREHE